jgi:hypothetical protein
MKNKIIYIAFFIGVFSLGFVACDDNVDPLIGELKLSRALAPIDLTARVRNQTTIELNWSPRADAQHYVVEISEDNLEFSNIIHTATLTANELPYQKIFESETLYSVRVKAVSADGAEDSRWTTITIATAAENIFLPLQDEDIGATGATLNWTANSAVTHFIINPGNVERTITADEKTAGVATISGLTGETNYTVQMKNNTKNRGLVEFTTAVDIGTATAVNPGDDLAAIITAAQPGDVLALFPGDYTVNTGAAIIINKAISLKGVRSFDKPKLHVQFHLTGAGDVEFRDLDLDGDATLENVFEYKTAGIQYGSLAIKGCNIHDFKSRLIYGNVASKVTSFEIDNSVLTDLDLAASGDFIDFRLTYVAKVTLTNSTFDNCAPGRDFVRLDAAPGYTATSLTSAVLIDHCTLYGVSNSLDRILYVRFNSNTLTVKNTLIVATDGYFTNQTASTQPTCTNNNYFNAPGFYTSPYLTVTNLKIDNSGTHSTLDPGFADAVSGNFKVSNQTIKDNNIGDPRWLQ